MSKSFKESIRRGIKKEAKGIDSLIGGGPKPKVGRPRIIKRELTKTSEIGTKEGETRATFIIKEELIEKLKACAYWDRKLLKDVVGEALEQYIKKAKVKPRPTDERQKDQEKAQSLIKTDKKAKLPKY